MSETRKNIYTMSPVACSSDAKCALARMNGVCPLTMTTTAESKVDPARSRNTLYNPAILDESVRRPFHKALTGLGLKIKSGYDNFFLALNMAKGERNSNYQCNVEGGQQGIVYIDRVSVRKK